MISVIREMWSDGWSGKALVLLAILTIVLFLAFVADVSWTTSSEFDGVVIGQSYSPPTTSTGSGVGYKGTPVVTVSSSPEAWVLIVQADGFVTTAHTDASGWAACVPGTRVRIQRKVGLFGWRCTHVVVARYVEQKDVVVG